MLSPHHFAQVDLRCREAKRKENALFGGMATSISGDFLQLPPVDSPSLGQPPDETGYEKTWDHEDSCLQHTGNIEKKKRMEAEHRHGYELWREHFHSVTTLTHNMRTTGVLVDILQCMRSGHITDKAWKALRDRVIGNYRDRCGNIVRLPDHAMDPRLAAPPFSTSPVQHILQRHQLRVCQSFCNAVEQSSRLSTPLYVSVACDVCPGNKNATLTNAMRETLLRQSNLHKIKNLPSTLPLYRSMRLLLYSKECARLLLMNGCVCILEDILFNENEDLPAHSNAGSDSTHLLTHTPPLACYGC